MSKPIRILYVHGYEGHGNGKSSKLVRDALDKRGIKYELDAPQFPVTEPDEMSQMLSDLIHEHKYRYVVASSMGAIYALPYVSPCVILVNPALPKNLRAIRDAEPEKHPALTDELLAKLEEETEVFFKYTIDFENWFVTYFVFGEHDDVAGNEEFFFNHYHQKNHIYHADMGHIMEPAGAEKVVDIIEYMEREQPVYVDPLEVTIMSAFDD